MPIFKTSRARENILSRIRKGLAGAPAPMPYPDAEKDTVAFFAESELPADEAFAEAFIKLGGKFVFCDHEQEVLDNIALLYEARGWHTLLCADERLARLFHNNKIEIVKPADPPVESADACITDCEALIGWTGSILLSSKQHLGRTASIYYPVHIVVAYANQAVRDIADGLELVKKKYGTELPSMLNLATGPSRTADIEKTLVVGVHGPGEVFCFFVNADL